MDRVDMMDKISTACSIYPVHAVHHVHAVHCVRAVHCVHAVHHRSIRELDCVASSRVTCWLRAKMIGPLNTYCYYYYYSPLSLRRDGWAMGCRATD